MKNLKKITGTTILIVGMLGLAGCSQAASPTNTATGSTGDRSVKVIVSTIGDSSPVYIAQEQGLFDELGLDVTIAAAPTPGARIPSLVSGAADISLIGTADVVQAASAGIDLRLLGQTSQTSQDPKADTGQVFVSADSDIQDVSDLNGRTVAVGGLGGGGELSLRAALDMAGADSKQVKFLEVPFDSMVNALETGQVDAISAVTPFTMAAEAAGARWLISPGATAMPGAAQQLVVATGDYLSENDETAKLFMEALNKAIVYASENPDAVRKILPTFSKTPAEIAEKMLLPEFNPDLTVEKVEKWSELMFEYGFIKTAVDVEKLMATGS